jgi:cbb3-type cytochrome oxidase maturation protein
MEIMYLLVPISVVLVFLIGAVFWWSLRHGQFEDLEGPAYRVLMDDDSPHLSKGGPTADDGRARQIDESHNVQ